MEKKILLLSNSPHPGGSQENSLSNFEVCIPSNFLETHKSWTMALESAGLHLQLKNLIVPQNEAMPSILQINNADFNAIIAKYRIMNMSQLSLNMFSQHHKIFIDGSKSYSARQLTHHINNSIFKYALKYKQFWNGVPANFNKVTKTIEFGQFLFNEEFNEMEDEKSKNKWRTYVFIHQDLMQNLKFKNIEVFEETSISEEKYYYFSNSAFMKLQDFYPLQTQQKDFKIKKPDLVQIISPNIESTIFNGTYSNILKQFHVEANEIGDYLHRNFISHDFFKLRNECNSVLRVRIVDENMNLLRLRPGFPTYVKLIFKSEKMSSDFIRVSSIPTQLYPRNTFANFSLELPKTLDYTYKADPKIALSSITLENNWKILPGLLLNIYILNIDTGKEQIFICPKDQSLIRNCNQICKWFENQIKSASHLEIRKVGGKYEISFNANGVILISRDLAQIIGLPFMDKDLANTSIHAEASMTLMARQRGGYKVNFYQSASEMNTFKKKIDESIMAFNQSASAKNFFENGNIALTGEKNAVYSMQYTPREIQLFPNLLYIYSNIVKPSPVNDSYRQLLRIVPLPFDESERHFTVTFFPLEFMPISQLNIQLLQFKIVTHDDLYAEPLNENSIIYMNLIIKHE